MSDLYIDSTHNVLYRADLMGPDKWLEDLKKSGKSHVAGYQEAEDQSVRRVLRQFCKATGRGLYMPRRCGNPISWNTSVFTPVLNTDGKPFHGVHDSHLGAMEMGINAKFNPPRDFTWVGLQHIATGKRVLRINVHPLAGGTKAESAPDFTDSRELAAWKDWGVGQYWLDVLAFTAEQMSVQTPAKASTITFWDVVTLGGDYNAALDNTREWYYPGAMLPALYVQDARYLRGLDHLQHTHHSDVKVNRRWNQKGNTDHMLHFVERQFVNVADFPRDR